MLSDPNKAFQPMTVLQMVPELKEGGVELATVEMAGHLTQKGHTSLVISEGGRLVPRITAEGSTHLTYAYVGEKSPRCLLHILALRNLLIREKVDVLHLRSRLPAWVGYLAWLSLAQPMRPKLVTTFHGFYSVNAYSAIMARGQKIIAVSNTIKAHIQQQYNVPGERITVIHDGFDADRFSPERVGQDRTDAIKARWCLNDSDVPLIFFPGRITRLKGHALFIESLSLIRSLPWIAVCAGDLNENPDLAAELGTLIKQYGMENRIFFTGYCDDMPAAMTVSHVVVAPSIKPESFGRTAVEAQAMGKPIIATAHGGSLETVLDRKSGWLVSPVDPHEMAAALTQALSDKRLASQMGQTGQRWVGEKFKARDMLDRTVHLYEELIHGSKNLNPPALV